MSGTSHFRYSRWYDFDPSPVNDTANDTDSDRANNAVSSVERAFRLLAGVVASPNAVGVRELARDTGLPRSSVSRLLTTLEGLGMVERAANGSVRPGAALASLQPGADRPAPDLPVLMRPILEQLAAEHRENIALSVDDGDRVLYVDEVASASPISVPVSSGQRFPFHVVAPGLVLMAAWPDDRLNEYIDSGLAAPTDHSITTADDLWARIRYVRRRGYAWTDQELDLEVNGLALPVTDDEGRVVAAVSLYGPAYRLAEHIPGSMILVDSVRAALAQVGSGDAVWA